MRTSNYLMSVLSSVPTTHDEWLAAYNAAPERDAGRQPAVTTSVWSPGDVATVTSTPRLVWRVA